jgi:hypothetical protein
MYLIIDYGFIIEYKITLFPKYLVVLVLDDEKRSVFCKNYTSFMYDDTCLILGHYKILVPVRYIYVYI